MWHLLGTGGTVKRYGVGLNVNNDGYHSSLCLLNLQSMKFQLYEKHLSSNNFKQRATFSQPAPKEQ